ncbi:glycosyltransferase [bacterium]|nr:glycosyltransferase [candidate division CSSED10-310 bacterium]
MSGKPSVLLIDECSGIGGAETVLLQVIDAWNEHYRFHCVLPAEGHFAARLNRLGIPVFFNDIRVLKTRWLRRKTWKTVTDEFLKIIDTVNPDVLVSNSLWTLTSLYFALRRRPVTNLCAVHASIRPKRFLKRLGLYQLDRFITSTPILWITVSQALSRELAAIGIHKENIRVIPNGVDIDRFSPRKREPFEGPSTSRTLIIVGTMGRLHPGKGQELFVEMAFRISSKYPDVRFLIVGEEIETPAENLNFTRALANRIRDLGLEEKVRITGFQADPAEILGEMDIFVLASREESFGLAVLEAMACGIPVVVSGVGGLQDLVRNAVDGHVVSPGNSDAFAAAVSELIENESGRKLMSAAARERALQFNRDETMRQWKSCLDEAVRSGPGESK